MDKIILYTLSYNFIISFCNQNVRDIQRASVITKLNILVFYFAIEILFWIVTFQVVVLDCQHFYGFTQLDHENLIQLFNKSFGAKLLPYSNHMNYITLEYMTAQYRYQVCIRKKYIVYNITKITYCFRL